MPHHKKGAYDRFDSLAEMVHHYRRCRKRQYFILSDKAISTEGPKCAVCKEGLTAERGNRCQYHPRGKAFLAMHYDCSWSALFADIMRLGQRM